MPWADCWLPSAQAENAASLAWPYQPGSVGALGRGAGSGNARLYSLLGEGFVGPSWVQRGGPIVYLGYRESWRLDRQGQGPGHTHPEEGT